MKRVAEDDPAGSRKHRPVLRMLLEGAPSCSILPLCCPEVQRTLSGRLEGVLRNHMSATEPTALVERLEISASAGAACPTTDAENATVERADAPPPALGRQKSYCPAILTDEETSLQLETAKQCAAFLSRLARRARPAGDAEPDA